MLKNGKDLWAVLKNAKEHSRQLGLFPMPLRLCSKSYKLLFSSAWIKIFQMFKLALKKAEEPKILYIHTRMYNIYVYIKLRQLRENILVYGK